METPMKLRLSTDLVTGALFIALGGFAIIYGSRYAVGTTARMGPGYFPMLISASLVLVGVVLVGRALLSAGDALGAIRWRPLVLILAGVLSFGFLIDRAGLLAAGILLIVASRLADRELRPIETVLLAIGLTLATGAVFLYGLGLPIKWLRV
jgi:hypothetical protein